VVRRGHHDVPILFGHQQQLGVAVVGYAEVGYVLPQLAHVGLASLVQLGPLVEDRVELPGVNLI
jgi:hypothetical protein